MDATLGVGRKKRGYDGDEADERTGRRGAAGAGWEDEGGRRMGRTSVEAYAGGTERTMGWVQEQQAWKYHWR